MHFQAALQKNEKMKTLVAELRRTPYPYIINFPKGNITRTTSLNLEY